MRAPDLSAKKYIELRLLADGPARNDDAAMSEDDLPLLPPRCGPQADVCVRVSFHFSSKKERPVVFGLFFDFLFASQSPMPSRSQRKLVEGSHSVCVCVLKSTPPLQWTMRMTARLWSFPARTLRVALSFKDAGAGIAGQESAELSGAADVGAVEELRKR